MVAVVHIPCISLVLVWAVIGQGKIHNASSISSLLNLATCKSMCKSGTCKPATGGSVGDGVRCVCYEGWRGDGCDVPLGVDALKMLRFSTLFPPPGTVDLGVIDKRVSNREGKCADNFVCHNGGYCVGDAVRGYNCKCTAPYTGTFCRELCERKCFNGGECFREIKLINGSMLVNKVCKCPRQYQGEFCEHKLPI